MYVVSGSRAAAVRLCCFEILITLEEVTPPFHSAGDPAPGITGPAGWDPCWRQELCLSREEAGSGETPGPPVNSALHRCVPGLLLVQDTARQLRAAGPAQPQGSRCGGEALTPHLRFTDVYAAVQGSFTTPNPEITACTCPLWPRLSSFCLVLTL